MVIKSGFLGDDLQGAQELMMFDTVFFIRS